MVIHCNLNFMNLNKFILYYLLLNLIFFIFDFTYQVCYEMYDNRKTQLRIGASLIIGLLSHSIDFALQF